MKLFAPILLLAAASASAQVTFVDATSGPLAAFTHHGGTITGDQPATNFGNGATVSDIDHDGDLDLYVVDGPGHPNKLYRNDGGGTFAEIGVAAGVADFGYGQFALFIDFDDDGWDDLLLINSGNATSKIFRNDRDSTFTDVTAGSGFAPSENIFGGAGAGDYDRDGDLDLSVVGWNDGSTRLYRNDGNFQFVDVTVAAGAKPDRDPTQGPWQWTVVHVDVDNDGWQDILSAVDFSANYLMRNKGDGTFEEVTDQAGIGHTGNDMGIAIADIDDDLDLDFYITDITGQGSSNCWLPQIQGGCNAMDLNDGAGVFTDVGESWGIDDTDWGWGTWFFDAELDGDLDLYAVNGFEFISSPQTAYFFRNDAGSFVEQGGTGLDHTGDSRALLPWDFDDDGDIDFLITDVESPLTLLENVTPRGDNHWLAVSARGGTGNAMGVGARVYVSYGQTTRMQELFIGGSFMAGPAVEAHFGVGTATTIDEVRVVMPPSRGLTLYDVVVDQRLNATPLEAIADLRASGTPATTSFSWSAIGGADGYAVTRGTLASLAAADLGACRASGLAGPAWDELESPAPGEGWVYQVQGTSGVGFGPFGAGATGVPRDNANASACR